MNSLRFNGGVLNGARVIAALALVSCTSTASVDASATYVHTASASMPASAAVVANSIRNVFGNSSDFIGSGYLTATATQNHRSVADVFGSADFVAYSLRGIGAESNFIASADFQAVPASKLGSADVVAQATVSAVATKTQPGHAALQANGSLTLGGSLVTRHVQANILGTATLYPEVGIDRVFEAYVNPTAGSSITIEDAGVVIKQVGALIYGTADAQAIPTHHQQGYAQMVGYSDTIFDPASYIYAFASMGASADVSAAVQYSRMASASVTGQADFAPILPKQIHTAKVNIEAKGEISPSPSHVHKAVAESINGVANAAWVVTYVASPKSNIAGGVEVAALASINHAAQSAVQANAQINSDPIVPVPQLAISALTANVLFEADGVITRLAYADITATGYLEPIGYRNLMGYVSPENQFSRAASVRTFTRNPNSRTFRR